VTDSNKMGTARIKLFERRADGRVEARKLVGMAVGIDRIQGPADAGTWGGAWRSSDGHDGSNRLRYASAWDSGPIEAIEEKGSTSEGCCEVTGVVAVGTIVMSCDWQERGGVRSSPISYYLGRVADDGTIEWDTEDCRHVAVGMGAGDLHTTHRVIIDGQRYEVWS